MKISYHHSTFRYLLSPAYYYHAAFVFEFQQANAKDNIL